MGPDSVKPYTINHGKFFIIALREKIDCPVCNCLLGMTENFLLGVFIYHHILHSRICLLGTDFFIVETCYFAWNPYRTCPEIGLKLWAHNLKFLKFTKFPRFEVMSLVFWDIFGKIAGGFSRQILDKIIPYILGNVP
jgi:hypothetical protein